MWKSKLRRGIIVGNIFIIVLLFFNSLVMIYFGRNFVNGGKFLSDMKFIKDIYSMVGILFYICEREVIDIKE